MGGKNQSTVPPAPKSSNVRASQEIRFHEENGEIHFHDDKANLKCAIPVATFFNEYRAWRDAGGPAPLILHGSCFANKVKTGHASANLTMFPDDKGELQIAINVQQSVIGQTVTALDTLAGY